MGETSSMKWGNVKTMQYMSRKLQIRHKLQDIVKMDLGEMSR
jgi:hypothetical protein